MYIILMFVSITSIIKNILHLCFRINLSGGMQNVLGRIAATLVILCPVIVFSIPESALQASSIKSSQTEQVNKFYAESIRIYTQ